MVDPENKMHLKEDLFQLVLICGSKSFLQN